MSLNFDKYQKENSYCIISFLIWWKVHVGRSFPFCIFPFFLFPLCLYTPSLAISILSTPIFPAPCLPPNLPLLSFCLYSYFVYSNVACTSIFPATSLPILPPILSTQLQKWKWIGIRSGSRAQSSASLRDSWSGSGDGFLDQGFKFAEIGFNFINFPNFS